MTPKTKLLISAGLAVVGFALIKLEDFENRKRAARNEEILKHNAAKTEAFYKNVAEINDDLDRRIEAGKFWLIVTNPDN
jgi:hypothetical protein